MRFSASARVLAASLVAVALASCAADAGSGLQLPETHESQGSFPTLRCAPTVTGSSGDRVLDPRLDGFSSASFRATIGNEGVAHPAFRYSVVAVVRRDGAELAVLGERTASPGEEVGWQWDGRIAGHAAEPGAYELVVRASCIGSPAAAEVPLRVNVVRVAVAAVRVGDGEGRRVPLLYHRAGGLTRNYFLVPADVPVVARSSDPAAPGAVDLDADHARPFVEPWTDLAAPPLDGAGQLRATDLSIPVALVLGTRADLTLVFAASAVGGAGAVATGLPVADVPIRAVVEGYTPTGPDLVEPGGAATFRADVSPAPAVGRRDVPIRISYEWLDDGAWRPMRGSESFTLRVYGVLGESVVRPGSAGSAPWSAWVAVVDQVSSWAAGATDPTMVTAAIVRGTYDSLGLVYDRRSGASAYTEYDGFNYDGASFDLTAFLSRDNGNVVNCSDCASIVSTFASMMGVDSRYHIIGFDFDLNFIRAIGTPDFTEFPFLSGRGGFNYHAVTSFDHNGTIFDATLQVDGDPMPWAPPHVATYAAGLTAEAYLSALSSERVRLYYDDHTSIR